MKPDGRIKLVAELLDLPLLDTEGKFCGIVDDVELDGGPGKELRLKALLVGPGAYRGRLPGWAMWLARTIAGERTTRVPIDNVRAIDSLPVIVAQQLAEAGIKVVQDRCIMVDHRRLSY